MENDPYSTPAANFVGASPAPVPAGVIDKLKRTKPWVRFIGVLMWIAIGFMVLGALAMTFATRMMSTEFDKSMPGMGGSLAGAMVAAYLLFGMLYVYPAVKIWSYGTAIDNLVNTRSHDDLEKALDHQRSFWKFCGIIALVMIAAYLVVIVLAVGGGMFAAVRGG